MLSSRKAMMNMMCMCMAMSMGMMRCAHLSAGGSMKDQ